MIKEFIDFKEYLGLVSSICRDISLEEWKPDLVVGITRGGLLPAKLISHYFNVPMHSLDVSLRDNNISVSDLGLSADALGCVPKQDKLGTSIDPFYRKNILIVDDINDSGDTFNWIMDDWQSNCLPNHHAWAAVWGKSTRFAVVVDNQASKCRMAMNYIGKEINKNERNVWIEFPYENWWTRYSD